MYMSTMTVSEARAALPEVLDRVEHGEEVTITRHGRPVAIVVRPDTLRSRRAARALSAAEQVSRTIASARNRALPHAAGITAERAEELVKQVRTGRDARR